MSESIIMQMAEKKGNRLLQIINDYGRKLSGFIRNRVNSNQDAEDILQDVWYQLSNVVDLDEIQQINSWLYRVAQNRITDKYRKKKESALDIVGTGASEDKDSGLRLFTEEEDPAMSQFKEVFWEKLFAALDELPSGQRDVFVWNELEEMTFQEIADMTGENIKTLISRKRYAVQFLRKKLEELYIDYKH
jgi:RNA polymerase sigma factor (sigma-70 family)